MTKETYAQAIERVQDNCTDNKLAAHAHKDCLTLINSLAAMVEKQREVLTWAEPCFFASRNTIMKECLADCDLNKVMEEV